jgi:antitoxin component of MazEF toxin-antitoxin module
MHIPVSVRKAAGLKRHGKATLSVSDGKIIIEPKKKSALKRLAGSLSGIKPIKKINIERIRDYIDYSDI